MTCVLYRIFDAQSTLLYVGKTIRAFETRLSDHLKKPWGGEIAREAARLEHFSDAATLALAEREAIRNENPKYNLVRYGSSHKAAQFLGSSPARTPKHAVWQRGVSQSHDVKPLSPHYGPGKPWASETNSQLEYDRSKRGRGGWNRKYFSVPPSTSNMHANGLSGREHRYKNYSNYMRNAALFERGVPASAIYGSLAR